MGSEFRIGNAWHGILDEGLYHLAFRIAIFPEGKRPHVTEQPTADCYPVSMVPGQSRLYLDFCSAAAQARAFYAAHPRDERWQQEPRQQDNRAAITGLLAEQNQGPTASPALQAPRMSGKHNAEPIPAMRYFIGLLASLE